MVNRGKVLSFAKDPHAQTRFRLATGWGPGCRRDGIPDDCEGRLHAVGNVSCSSMCACAARSGTDFVTRTPVEAYSRPYGAGLPAGRAMSARIQSQVLGA
jgi:hypothetical protein